MSDKESEEDTRLCRFLLPTKDRQETRRRYHVSASTHTLRSEKLRNASRLRIPNNRIPLRVKGIPPKTESP